MLLNFQLKSLFLCILLISLALAQQIKATQYIYFVFSPKCYNSLIQKFDITDRQCLKLTLSKLLGYGLVVGSAIVKVPQLIKILLDKSTYGISFTSVLMESMTNWVTIVYSWYRGNPFSIYGENAFLLGQNILILVLFIIYGRNVPKGMPQPDQKQTQKYIILLVLFILGMFITKDPFTWPPAIISYAMILQIFLFSSARLTQILHIFKCKSTGSLALATCLLLFLGNLGRLFTVFVEIGNDYMFALSIILATTLNGTVLAQFFIYWKNTKIQKEKRKQN